MWHFHDDLEAYENDQSRLIGNRYFAFTFVSSNTFNKIRSRHQPIDVEFMENDDDDKMMTTTTTTTKKKKNKKKTNRDVKTVSLSVFLRDKP